MVQSHAVKEGGDVDMKRGILLISILVSVGLLFFVSGCAKQQGAGSAALTEEQTSVSAGAPDGTASLASTHVVKSSECLWWIAEYEDIYNDPFMWPLIYDANKDKIDNHDRIYPGQTLHIPRSGYTMEQIMEARQRAGAPRPYTPPAGSIPPVD